jgi:acyl-CoA synthetase (AMP-forming)/AMP-acid ligase II
VLPADTARVRPQPGRVFWSRQVDGTTLQARLVARLTAEPDAQCLGVVDAHGRVSWRSRRDVYERACTWARGLADRGVRPGDACVLVLPGGEPAALPLLGVLLAGAVPLLVAPPTLQGRHSSLSLILSRTLRTTRARLVLLGDGLDAFGASLARRSASLAVAYRRDLEQQIESSTPASPVPPVNSVAAMQLTSGTTGFPRICTWSHRSVLAALRGMSEAMALSQRDVCLNWTPLYHDMGLVNNFLLCLEVGVPLALLAPTDFVKRPALWLRGLAATAATVTWSPNFGFALAAQRAQDADLRGVRLDHVRAFWNAAERIHFATMQAFLRRFEHIGVRPESLKTNFGCAENVGGATFSDPAGPCVVEYVDEAMLQAQGVAVQVPRTATDTRAVPIVGVGRPTPGIKLQIIGRGGTALPDGHVGEVALRTPSKMSGYLGRKRETGRAIDGTLLRTGDLGYLRKDELFWVGRLRERITLRGRKIDPSDFERVLLNIAGLRTGCFAAFGVDDPQRGTERLVIVAELRADADRAPSEVTLDIRGAVEEQLGIGVDEVLLVPGGTLAKTSSGKRRHRHVRQSYLKGTLGALSLTDRSQK